MSNNKPPSAESLETIELMAPPGTPRRIISFVAALLQGLPKTMEAVARKVALLQRMQEE